MARKHNSDHEAASPRDARDFSTTGGNLFSTDTPSAGESTQESIPETLGRYRILEKLGHGGMGAVYLAYDTKLERQVALKTPYFSAEHGSEAVRRFYREARAAATINHPNICPVYDVGEIDGVHFMAMSYIDGVPLSELIDEEGSFSARQVALAIRQLAMALNEAHERGVIHRDLKPANIMVAHRKELVVMDFGLARQLRASANDDKITHSGMMLGTPAYMSPEQVRGEFSEISPASDIYSLGVIMYEMLTGRTPFEGSLGEVLSQTLNDVPASPRSIEKGVDPDLEAICLKTLSKDAGRRQDSMADLAQDLTRYLRQTQTLLTTQAIGIDLGTTFSVLATVDETGRPVTLPSEEGDVTTPSVVLFDDDDVIVGREALRAKPHQPNRVAALAKRDIGLREVTKEVDGQQYPPEVIQAYILRKVVRDAERELGGISHAVISVPAYFDEVRRKATYDAARIAGITLLDLINEPTAAAISFGLANGMLAPDGTSERSFNVLVYDLGGGTFDVTVVRLSEGQFTTLATDGDACLGGYDWDTKLVDYVAEKFMAANSFDPRADREAAAKLWQECEEAKRTLSVRKKARVTCVFRGTTFELEIGREEFEKLTAFLLERTSHTTREVVRCAGLDWPRIDRVLVAGGATRMPMVRAMLKDLSGKEPDESQSPDVVVAKGAALHAGILLHRHQGLVPPFKVFNVNSHSLGVVAQSMATGDEENVTLISRNTLLPSRKTRAFLTMKDNQPDVVVRIVEGENPLPEACSPVGTLTVALPPGLPAKSKIEVKFRYRSNGRLAVSVRMPDGSLVKNHQIERKSGLSREEIAAWRTRVFEEI